MANINFSFHIAVQACCILLLAGGVLLFIQKRVLHPFHRYPGPWLNTMSEIPAAIALAMGRQQAYYRRLHSQYGDIVRVGPNELSFVDPLAWEDIYNRKNPKMEKHPLFIGAVAKAGSETGLSMALHSTKDHSRQRRALGYSFTVQALLQQQEIMLLHVKKLISQMQKFAHNGHQLDMTDWYTYTTFDLMGDLTFGQPFGCLDQQGNTEWSRAIIQVFVGGAWQQAVRRVVGIDTWGEAILTKLLVPKSAAQWRQLHLANSVKATNQRIQDGDRDHKDLIHFVLKTKEARQSISDRELLLNMVLLISAGSETTASTLTAWTYFICAHEKVLQRVAAEIRSTFKTTDEINWDTTAPSKLPYLDATIQEALRLIPPPSVSGQRIVGPGGATVCGEFVPEGYCVAVPPVAVTRLERNFARPTEFHPERWLARDDPEWDEQFASDKLSASQPFGLGPRVCLGKNLAYFELRLILSHVLWHFDVYFADPVDSKRLWTMDDDMKHLRGYLTWVKPPLYMKLAEVKR